MANHLSVDVIDFHKITITDQHIIIVWSAFPMYMPRRTEYLLTEFYQWVLEEPNDIQRGLDPFWVIEEMKHIIEFMVQEFHATHTDVYWGKEIKVLNEKIMSLKGMIRSLEVLVENLIKEKSRLLKKISQAIKSSFQYK